MNRREIKAGEVDLEAIAALLEDRLSPTEREVVVKQLAASEDAYAIFAEAVGIQTALAEAEGATTPESSDDAPQAAGLQAAQTGSIGASPIRTPPHRSIPQPATAHPFRRRRPLFAAAGLVAAGLAAAAGVILLLRPSVDLEPLGSIHRKSARAASAEPSSWRDQIAAVDPARLPAGWSEPPWSVERGDAASVASDARIDLRAGVRLTDLAAAVAAADAAAVRDVVGSLVRLLSGVEGAEPLVADADALLDRLAAGDSVVAMAPAVTDFIDHADDFFANSPYYLLGTWAESGRLAALAGARDHALRPLPSTVAALDFPLPLRTALDDLAAMAADPASADLTAVAASYQAVVAAERLQVPAD